jgi:hypothetical protein
MPAASAKDSIRELKLRLATTLTFGYKSRSTSHLRVFLFARLDASLTTHTDITMVWV